MGRSRYKVYEPTSPHFITCTILHWISIFTRQESVNIVLKSLEHLQENDNFKLFSYVILMHYRSARNYEGNGEGLIYVERMW